jgi:hypothetical protein
MLIPLVFPFKTKGEYLYTIAIDRFTPSLTFKGGLGRDQLYSIFSQDLYLITLALNHVAIEE